MANDFMDLDTTIEYLKKHGSDIDRDVGVKIFEICAKMVTDDSVKELTDSIGHYLSLAAKLLSEGNEEHARDLIDEFAESIRTKAIESLPNAPLPEILTIQ